MWLSLSCVPPAAQGSDATGAVRVVSCDFFERYRLELVRVQGKNMEKLLAFKLPGYIGSQREDEWIDGPGMECTRLGECESVGGGRVRITHVSNRSLTGNFVISFKDGRKLEGSFSAKWMKRPKDFICE
jgi:hypothetical protein